MLMCVCQFNVTQRNAKMTHLNSTTWARNIRNMAAAGTLKQGVWNAEREGRHIACILGASSPAVGSVKDVDCVALCMPEWLAALTPALFDGVSKDQADAYALRYADVAERWCELSPEAWDRVSVTFRVACIEQALASAKAVQPTPRPDYWDAVEAACEAMIAALKTGKLTDVAEASFAASLAATRARAEAADAARAAANATDAAGEAEADQARAEAAWAARAAANATDAAGEAEADQETRAAWAAAEAADAADAAGEAYSRLFDALLNAINAEIVQDARRHLAQAEAAEERIAKLYDAGEASHKALTAAIEATLNAVAYLAIVDG